jgi:DNA-binding XRE family transcriptional regulator
MIFARSEWHCKLNYSLMVNYFCCGHNRHVQVYGMGKLKSYIQNTGIKQVDLAAIVGISTSYMSEIAAGIKLPGRKVAVAIAAATDGDVPVTAWDEKK